MTDTNNAPQPVLTDDEIDAIHNEYIWKWNGDSRAFARAIESALLSKLRAPVADERAAQRPAAGRQYHLLKTDPEVFQAVLDGAKTFEIRMNDRGYAVGDALGLRETKHTGAEMRAGAPLAYTGRECQRFVSHVLTGYGLADGWCCLSFDLPHAGGASAPVAGEAVAEVNKLIKCEISFTPHGIKSKLPHGTKLYAAPQARPSDDDLWDQTLKERDHYHDMADRLANAIGAYFGQDAGEHSSSHCPWHEALGIIGDAAPQASEADAAAFSTAVDYRRMEDAPQAGSAMPEIGGALINDACWKFVAAMPHKLPGPIWNDLKPAIYAAICHVLTARQQPTGDVAYIARLRAALILARDSHGVSLLTDPPQDAWKARGVGDVIRAALSAQPGAQKEQSDA